MEALLKPVEQTTGIQGIHLPACNAQAGLEDRDDRVIEMWLHRRPQHTQRAYLADVGQFLRFAGRPLPRIMLGDVQAFIDTLEDLAPATQNRKVAAIKSLLSFAHRMGYCGFNVGAPIKAQPLKDTLAERILPEPDVQRLIAMETNPRNHVLLRLLYASGGRVSEICSLKWRDVQEREEGGQVTLYGKGGKTRMVLLSTGTWQALLRVRGDATPDDPVFRSRKGGHLDPSQVWRIVGAAARRAGIDGNVSPHWFRHSHASHALDRGCPIHLVQSTLGHSSVATTGRYLHVRPGDSSARYLAV